MISSSAFALRALVSTSFIKWSEVRDAPVLVSDISLAEFFSSSPPGATSNWEREMDGCSQYYYLFFVVIDIRK